MPVHLTRRNHQGGHLLRNIRTTAEQQPPADIGSHSPRMDEIKVQTEEDILALPESSDEEETSTRFNNSANTPGSTKRKREEEDKMENKRSKPSSKSTRSSQRKSKIEQNEDLPKSLFSLPDDHDWLSTLPSQPSQQRKMKAGYGRNNAQRSSARSTQEAGGARLNVPDDVADAGLGTPRKSSHNEYKKVQDSPKSARNSPQRMLKQPPPDVSGITKTTAKFSIPEDLSLEISSSTHSLDTENLRIFDGKFSPETSAQVRRGSTSSLSSVDSIASALLSQSQKDDLKNGVDTSVIIPPGYVQCPLCSEPVRKSPGDTTAPSKLSLREQQEYCHKHKLKDAHATWQTRGYPSIDWEDLETERIPNHIPYLTKVLLRKTSSFYFESLEFRVKAAKGNKRKINAYLLDGIMDVAKPGYYGGKGAKTMSHVIATSFAKQLKMALMQDEIIGTAGISGFTSAVLLPELCQRLIMEDLNISDQDEARRIMNESSDVGLLLYPDDDHVDLVEAD